MRLLRTLDVAGLLWLAGALAVLVWLSDKAPNTDAFYHAAVAELYLRKGWLSAFPWLPYTALGQSFPNVYLLQHALLVPLVAAIGAEATMFWGAWLFGVLQGLACYAVLRHWKVPAAGLWVALTSFASMHLLVFQISLKGGSAFFPIFVLFLGALLSQRWWLAFVSCWLSLYAYVGAPVLLGVALLHIAVVRIMEQRWLPQPLYATAGGLLAGMVLNPFWPGHWDFVWQQLVKMVVRDQAAIDAGLHGGIHNVVDAGFILVTSGGVVMAWLVLLLHGLRRRDALAKLDTRTVVLGVTCIGLLFASLLAGPKLFHLFLLCSVLWLPLMAHALGPWRRRAIALAIAMGALLATFNLVRMHRVLELQPLPTLSEYRQLAEVVSGTAAPGTVVVAPWEDFAALFFFDRKHRYVAGQDTAFLKWHDPERYRAYVNLYQARFSNPQDVMRHAFEDARVIVVKQRTQPALAKLLQSNSHFEQVSNVGGRWRIYRRR